MIIGRCVSDDREMNVSCLGVFVSNMNSAYYALLAGSFVLPLSRSTNQQPVRHRQSLSARRFRCLILQRCRGGITTTPGSPPTTQLSGGSLGNNFQRLSLEVQEEGHKHGIMKHLEEKLSIRSLDTSSGDWKSYEPEEICTSLTLSASAQEADSLSASRRKTRFEPSHQLCRAEKGGLQHNAAEALIPREC